ncbi:epoxyqueuosine reductase [Anaerovorax odorimutans]|uniref:epoxyqueuosine reductase n=1 Tax=Anaerovorax odorimutans TaxID=109327 RepID=UPI0003FE3E64|nr:epoxyqueuosine reductase [Anaerovorax odorimutans]
MRKYINLIINDFVKNYEYLENIQTKWGKPLVGFADAYENYIRRLKEIITPNHNLPEDVIPDAKVIIAYYIPFTKELALTNKTGNILASKQWALAYEETNSMFIKLNEHLIKKLKEKGYNASIAQDSLTFDQKTLKSNWSQRHFAYAAGLGTFGLNNMLITKQGCCGRFSSIVTNLNVETDHPIKEDYCLYKKYGTCGICVKNCPVKALKKEGYDRHLCYGVLQKNAEIYTDFGSSYVDETGINPNSVGSDVCGKCITQSPCAFWNLR